MMNNRAGRQGCWRQGWWQRAAMMVVAITIVAPGAFAQGTPCGGLRVDDGQVTGKLPAAAKFSAADAACVDAVAAAIKARPRVRSVTIAVRAPADKRADATAVAAAWTKALVAGGVPEARISTLVAAGEPGSVMVVSIAFREPQPRPVALVQAMTGDVKSGLDLQALAAAAKGSKLTQGDHVVTGKGAVVRLALADGSFVALLPDTAIRLGRIELTRDLKRAVQIDLLRGKVEAIAEPRGDGSSFDIATRTAVAGVRGTRFRVGVGAADVTAVETVSGAVELAGTGGSKERVLVTAGQASKVDDSGKPMTPRPLLPEAEVEGPRQGPAEADAVLRWRAVPGATKYQVELGLDGELATGLQSFEVAAPSAPLPKGLADGQWYWRVSAVDKDGFVGMASKTYSFVRATPVGKGKGK